MKPCKLLAALLIASACLSAGASPTSQTRTIQGDIAEVQNAAGYTYLRVKTKDGEAWAAVPKADVKVGAKVTIESSMTMEKFESKSLKKKFDKIAFGVLAGPAGAPAATAGAVPAAPAGHPPAGHPPAGHAPAGHAPAGHAPAGAPAMAAAAPVAKVTKATGPDARTVAEVVAGKATLKDKTVLVRGQVVKVNAGILGKNWLHLQDGSGSAADGTNDVLVTTQDAAAVGDVVTARGTVRTDVNLGMGYAYAVVIDEATVRK